MVSFSSQKFLGRLFVTVLTVSGVVFSPLSAQSIAIREATIRSVRCVSPSSGVNNVSRAAAAAVGGAVGGATATVAAGATGGVLIGTLGLAIAGGAGTGVTVINGLDSVFSGTDDLYIMVNGNRAWPSSRSYTEVRSQQRLDVNYTTPLTGATSIELMEYDSVSGDDSMGVLILQPMQLSLPGERQWLVPGTEGSTYEIAVEISVANKAGFQLGSNAASGATSSITNRTLDRDGIYQSGTYLRSENDRYRLVMQGDGNLVMYDNSSNAAVWSSGTSGRGEGPFRAVMQNDGNFAIYNSQNQSIWATGTNGRGSGSYRLVLQDDRNLVLYDANNTVHWASNTNI